MSRHPVGISSLRRSAFTWSGAPLHLPPAIAWWPSSLPGSDLDEPPQRKPARPARRRIRRGRIQLAAA